MTNAFKDFLASSKQRCDSLLDELITELHQRPSNSPQYDSKLIDAMRYSLLIGGKRVRPVLAYAAAHAISAPNSATDQLACALECVHTYSLIHDDLPAMDDDSLRRGQPTCHIQFDEATAILAGDALQCLAFEIIASTPNIEPSLLLKAINELALASGSNGMVLGQAIDLAAVNKQLGIEELEQMHSYKTGALIEASVVLGAISVEATEEQILALRRYAKAIGLAFQVQDDIIDVTSDTQTLGKTQGADADKNKPTYVSLLGLEAAKEKAQTLRDTAIESLESFGDRAEHLKSLADFIIERKY